MSAHGGILLQGYGLFFREEVKLMFDSQALSFSALSSSASSVSHLSPNRASH